MVKLYNTLSREVEDFVPLKNRLVRMYTCGPTVYDYTHIGHLKKYIGDDLLRRVLKSDGYEVKHVMNITDVGHLVSDADEGEDKIERMAKEKGMTPGELVRFFEDYFFKSTDAVNIQRPTIVSRATEHIKEEVELIKKLFERGFAYQADQAIYFDVSKFPTYTKLSGQKLKEKAVGVREEAIIDPQKRNPQDFALWFFAVGRFAHHVLRWPSSWGEGFPGWHIECSAMSMHYLGETLDIHTGGIDHIPVHHTNEIAQSEGATGKLFSRFWVHHDFLVVDGEKMSKSKRNFYTIDDLKEKGFDPLAFRYLVLTAHYRDKLNFTWESLQAAQNALNNLREAVRSYQPHKTSSCEANTEQGETDRVSEKAEQDIDKIWQKFMDAANNDLNIPQALAVIWELIRSDTPTSSKSGIISKMDQVLGLELNKYLGKPLEIPKEVQKLVSEREKARENKNFQKSDEIRDRVKEMGFEIEDTPSGPKLK